MGSNHITFYQKEQIEIVYGEGTLRFLYHTHKSFLIGVIQAGSANFRIGSKQYRLSKDMVYLVPPDTGTSLIPDATYKYLTICIKGDLRQKLLRYQINDFVVPSVGKEISKLCRCFLADGNEQALFCKLIHLLKLDEAEAKSSRSNADFVSDAVKYIDGHIEDKIYLENIAEAVHVSKYYLIREFKKEMGISPKQYILQGKIRYAKSRMFKEPSAVQLALDLNFSAQSHLCSIFKRYMGISINDYKKGIKRVQ